MAARTVCTVRLSRDDLDSLPPQGRSRAILDLMRADIQHPNSIMAAGGGLYYGESAGVVNVSIPAELLPEVIRRRGSFSTAVYLRELVEAARLRRRTAPTTHLTARPTGMTTSTASLSVPTPTTRVVGPAVAVLDPRRREAAERPVARQGIKGAERMPPKAPAPGVRQPARMDPAVPRVPQATGIRNPAPLAIPPAPVVTMVPAANGTLADLARWRQRTEEARYAPGHVLGVWRPLLATVLMDSEAETALDKGLCSLPIGRSAALLVGVDPSDSELALLPPQEMAAVGQAVERVAVDTASGFTIETTVFAVPVEDRAPGEEDEGDEEEGEQQTMGVVMLFTFRRTAA